MTYTLNGVLADKDGSTAGVLTKTGAGVVESGSANSYTGGTNIQAGTLRVLPSGSISGSLNVANGATFDVSQLSGFTVASGQSLTTSGTGGAAAAVTGNLTVNGTLAPGGARAVGNLAVTGSLTLGGTLQADLVSAGQNDSVTAPSLDAAERRPAQPRGDQWLPSDRLALHARE